jgi:hypothetical protein
MYRLISTVRGGTNNAPQTWKRYATIEAAREGAKQLMHENNRVTRVMVLDDERPGGFTEWIERS